MELLAPAGSWEGLLAAIENGADAVYIGAQNFSARQYAKNFDDQQLKKAIEYAHLRNKKLYLTVNTLIDNQEFNEALDLIWYLYNLNIDALIMQDLGLIKAVRDILPGMKIHASTQMTIHNSAGANWLSASGVKRVVLAREMSYQEISTIHQEAPNTELEVFVHGAMCYSYSGQCLFSSLVGGRSGNRGRCAQPCRLKYDIFSQTDDSKIRPFNSGRHLLSPSDLCLIDFLPQLESAGVKSLKIEGRMKRAEYVAVVTKAYREACDLLTGGFEYSAPEKAKKELSKIFNRNFSSGHFVLDKQEFLSTQRPNNRGVYIGRVISQDSDLVTYIKLNEKLKIGDGIDIWVKHGKGPSCFIKQLQIDGKQVGEAGPGDTISIKLDKRVSPHDRVFKTHDEELISAATATIKVAGDYSIDVDVTAYLLPGKPLKLVFTDERNNQVKVATNSIAQKALKHPVDEMTLRAKVDRLGNTPFRLRNFTLFADGELMIPFSEINAVRREAVEKLISLNIVHEEKPEIRKTEYDEMKGKYLHSKSRVQPREQTEDRPILSIIVSDVKGAYAAARGGAKRVYLSLEGMGHKRIPVREIVELKEQAVRFSCEIIPALPRIQKPMEIKKGENLYRLGFDHMLVANLGALKWSLDRNIKTRVDYPLNIFNSYTMDYLLDIGVAGVCLSPELNFTQLRNFSRMNKAEILIHGEIILMVSEFCMLSGVLGGEEQGQKHCHKDGYYIKDEKGFKFPVATDTNCRFYVFNSRTLCMIENLTGILALNPGSLRIEARRYNQEQITKIVENYSRAIDEIVYGSKPDLVGYKKELERVSNSPFTKGHYFRGVL